MADLMVFVERLQALQLHRDTAEELIKDLLLYSQGVETTLTRQKEQLMRQLHEAQLDLADATTSRRDLQQKMQQLETSLGTILENNEHLKVRPRQGAIKVLEQYVETMLQSHNPYVVLLIDGDGLLFKEQFIKQGIEGGRKAAYALKAAILKECHGPANEIEVIAKVCVNLDGLARAMKKAGSLENESDLKDFFLGFSQGVASFDIVDVGYGKSRVESKIQEATKWHLKNYNCKQIILGISHEAGYATFLGPLLQDATTTQRITILEGPPIVRELAATGLNKLNLNSTIFRSEKLVERIPSMPTTATVRPLPPPVTSPRAAPAATAPRSASTPAAPPTSYAKVIKNASPPPQMTLPLQPKVVSVPKPPQASKPPPWNPGPRGLDPPLQISKTALDNIKKRKDNNKLCNNHYLRGPCSKGDQCCFEHKYKPTPDEIVAIAFLTRLNPCTSGQDCEVENCIYGHHCPTVINGECNHPNCKFRVEDHPPGTVIRNARSSKSYDDY